MSITLSRPWWRSATLAVDSRIELASKQAPCFMAPLRVRYQTLELAGLDIHVRSLRDTQEFPDDDDTDLGLSPANWSLFGVVWDSSQELARLMVDYDIADRRILEVGCGLGLATLVLNQRNADVSATDQHPHAERFLAANVALNQGAAVPFARAAWDQGATELGRFDLVIGSDLLYERDHAELLCGFIEAHARPRCEVILVDPGRGQLGRFGRLMGGLGYTRVDHPTAEPLAGQERYRGQTHGFVRDRPTP